MISINRPFHLLVIFIILGFVSHAQNDKSTTIINKQIEIVEYEYDYVYWGFQTSVSFGLFNSFILNKGISDRQLFFENGRNIRAGFTFGVEQSLKISNWELTTGISYQQYNENFSYLEYSIEDVVIQDETGNLRPVQLALGNPVLYSRDNYLGYIVSPIKICYYPELFDETIRISLQGDFKYLLRSDYKGKFSLAEPLIQVEGFSRYLYAVNLAFAYRLALADNLSIIVEPLYSIGLNNQIDRIDFSYRVNHACVNIYLSVNY